MKQISVRAVLLGVLSGFAMDMVAGIVLFVVVALASSEDIVALVQDADAIGVIATNPAFFAGALPIGTITTAIAAYITASLAERRPYVNALVMGGVALALTAFLAIEYPVWFNVATVALAAPACVVGAHVGSSKEERQPTQALQTTPVTRSRFEKTIVFGNPKRGV